MSVDVANSRVWHYQDIFHQFNYLASKYKGLQKQQSRGKKP